MLSRNLEQTLHRALSLASERRHEYATLEHLLLGLADDTDAATVLRACGVDLDKLRTDKSPEINCGCHCFRFLERATPPLTRGEPVTRVRVSSYLMIAVCGLRTNCIADR